MKYAKRGGEVNITLEEGDVKEEESFKLPRWVYLLLAIYLSLGVYLLVTNPLEVGERERWEATLIGKDKGIGYNERTEYTHVYRLDDGHVFSVSTSAKNFTQSEVGIRYILKLRESHVYGNDKGGYFLLMLLLFTVWLMATVVGSFYIYFKWLHPKYISPTIGKWLKEEV